MRKAASLLVCVLGLSTTQANAQGLPKKGSGDTADILAPAQGAGFGRKGSGDDIDFYVATEFPGLQRLTRRESESDLFERIRQESKGKPGTGRVFFPEYKPLAKGPLEPRSFPSMVEVVEPLVTNHGRLYFEQPNFERQGWDLGFFSPAVCLGIFYYDVLMFPYHFWTRPCDCCDSSAGKCLPGDPTPLYLYREPFSLTGLAGQGATVFGGILIFP